MSTAPKPGAETMVRSQGGPRGGDVPRERQLQALLRQRLGAFTERCFHEVAPSHAYAHSWHMEALAYHLTEVVAGRCHRLVITLPPRSLKSLSASIALPAWVLGREPHRRIICVSYANDLAVAHANSFRAVVATSWYKALFPAMRVDPRKDTETELRTTGGGYRLTTTVGGSLTGRGGSIIVIDDPIKAADAQSEAARTRVNTWFDETLVSRLDDKRTDAIVIVMQRLHVDDLAGHVLRAGGWTHLDLPAISEHAATVPIGPGQVHHRPADDVLHPEREPRSVLDALRATMGSTAFSAQYQQRPVPTGGNMVRWSWFGTWDHVPAKQPGTQIVQSWDTASKAAELCDYSVGITALVSRGEIHVLDLVRERLEYPALKRRIVAEKGRWKPDAVLIEDKGSGTSLIQDLRADRVHAIAIKPEGDKVVRMSACSARIEAGSVFLPRNAPWLGEFKAELLAFPHGTHDDQVDALSQLINWTRTRSTYTLDNVG
jgi:predicted phage terminase large subunit-like protein